MTTIYFSALLKQKRYLPFYNRLVKLFNDNSLSCKFVEETKDIWMRDFMPIKSMDGKYIQFDYHPIYLKKYPEYITYGSLIAKQLGIEIIKTDIKLDGGNFVCYKGKAIITSRIFKENPQYKKQNLIDKITDLLKLNKIIIIEEEYDDYGHSDGMVRFIDDTIVLINEYSKKHLKYKKKLTDVLEREGLKYIEIPSTDNMINAIGLYINYLQLENIIVLPAFNIDNDKKALEIFKEIFKEYKILQLDCTEIAKDGGVLNCISWQL